jgi:hypothetical protein
LSAARCSGTGRSSPLAVGEEIFHGQNGPARDTAPSRLCCPRDDALARKLILAVVLGMLLIVVARDYAAVRDDLRDYEQRIADDVATLGYGLSVTLAQVVRASGPAAAEGLIARRNLDDRLRIRWVALDVPPADKRAVDLTEEMVAALRQGQPVRIIRGKDSSARLFVYRAFIGEPPVHDVVEASESLAPMHERARRRNLGIVVESVVIVLLGAFAESQRLTRSLQLNNWPR